MTITTQIDFQNKITSYQKENNRIKELIVEYKMLIIELNLPH